MTDDEAAEIRRNNRMLQEQLDTAARHEALAIKTGLCFFVVGIAALIGVALW